MNASLLPDILAPILTWALWQGFAWLVESSRWAKNSLSASVIRLRLQWMLKMCDRDNRILDSTLIGNLMHSVSFLASATIIILGAVLALLGASDRLHASVQGMPFLAQGSQGLMQLKLLTLGLVFVYAFFKFSWSLRQFNYCCVVIGGAPPVSASDDEKLAFAKKAARVGNLGARSFNQGLRAYYFSLTVVGWFIHPAAMIVAALMVVAVLWRREFHSRTRRALGQY